jgi:hypothetical protein
MKRLTVPMLCLLAPGLSAAAPKSKDQFVTLDVQPAAAPTPVMRYTLLPEVAEMNPGNAVPAYLKSFCEQINFFHSKEAVEERERLRQCPLTDIKPGQLKNYGGYALKQTDHAARLEYADWNILPQIREHGYFLVIPDVQQMRALSTALLVRGRGELVDKDYDGAVHTMQTIFAMARHMGEHPTLISGLVGAAIAQQGLILLEEFVQQPGAPNLYWALTDLPQQLVDTRKAASADRMVMDRILGPLSDPKHAWTPEEIPVALKKANEVGMMLTEMPADQRQAAAAWVKERLADGEWLAEARKFLTARGYPADAVARYPAEQVLFFKLFARARAYRDEGLKWLHVPYWQAEEGLGELNKPVTDMEERLARLVAQPITQIRAHLLRLEQWRDLLRIVEAMRLDAAKNGGKLPASLNDLSVPVPNDPGTGKPFGYKVDGLTATLDAKPTTLSDGSAVHYRYEVRLRK